MSDSTTPLIRLTAALHEFELHWQQTRLLWDDPAGRTFERDHLNPIIQQIRAMRAELESEHRLIQQARRQVR